MIFFGTAAFAVPSLEAVVARHQVAVCVTQPDRPQGRGLKPQASPVKRVADAAGIPAIQPGRLRRADCDAYPADVGVVAAYGQLLPADVSRCRRWACWASIRRCCRSTGELPRWPGRC